MIKDQLRTMKKSILIAFLAVLVAGAQLTTAGQKIEKIVGGPFVVNVTPRSATIAWIVQGNDVTVRPQNGTAVLSSPALRTEKTTLTSLQPNTRYEYNVSSDADAGTGSFKTPPTGSEPYRFVVYGDNRTRHDVHRRVIAELMKHGMPDFILQTGDMVENGNDAAQWPVFFEIERELLRQTVFFPSMGNHERSTHYFEEIFHEGPSYYSFDWGNSHITVIDSELDSAASSESGRNAFWSQQLRWIEEDLQSHQKAGYRFVVAHHPPYTAVASRQGSNAHMTALTPMLERYHVSAGFFGHDHNYQHYLKNGVHYVTTGGGGAPLYDVDTPPADIVKKVASTENFVVVRVNGKKAHLEAVKPNGEILEAIDLGQ